ncbi:homocysteine S-methyltransferase family protein, partial [Streptomyces niveus]|uniref:homocysteine S-methyltransferase family protein n=1 Tax=Streptomyces niveus TaxID=193462 RepID=UPI0033EFFD62
APAAAAGRRPPPPPPAPPPPPPPPPATHPSPFSPDRLHNWQSTGARLLGGCCRVGPARITELAAALDAERGAR